MDSAFLNSIVPLDENTLSNKHICYLRNTSVTADSKRITSFIALSAYKYLAKKNITQGFYHWVFRDFSEAAFVQELAKDSI